MTQVDTPQDAGIAGVGPGPRNVPSWSETGGDGGVRASLRAAGLLWGRELIRLRRQPLRLVMGLLTPLLFLVVLGTGLEAADVEATAAMQDYRTYLFPGVLLMAVQTPAIAVGVTIVLDRKVGILRQILVAPVRRWSVVLGLVLGGSSSGALYGLFVLAVAGVADIPYTPALLLVLAELWLISMAFTAMGMLAAVTIRNVETFQIVVGLAMTPMMFLSGAMFPPQGLPGWLGVVVHANPLTYAVDAIRRTLPGDAAAPGTTPSIAGWTPPVLVELGLVAVLVAVAVAVATVRFARSE